MNDTFEIKRFGLLFKKTILERPLQFVGLTGLILIATLVIYALALYTMGWNQAQNMAFVWGLAGGGCFLSSGVFNYFGTNASGAAYLTLPASALEKWLCGVLIAGIFYTCIFLAVYRLIDIYFVTVYHNGLDKNNPNYKELFNAVQVYTFDNNIAKQSAVMFVNFAGAMMLGALYFNRVSAIKTALVYCGVLAAIFSFNLFLAHVIFQNVDFAFPFNNIFIKVGNDDASLELPPTSSNIVAVAFQFILPVVLWLTVYIRLREKEI
jgi:hypothetical protein